MEQFTGCEASPKSLLYTYIGTMHGALGTSFSLSRSLSLSSSHVTSHKHWHTDRRILSLYPVFLPRLNRLFVFLYNIQFNNWQSDSTRLDVLKKKVNFLCSHPACTQLRSLRSITQSSNSGGIQQETVSLVIVTGSDFFSLCSLLFAFISLSFLNKSLRRWGRTHTKAWQCTILLLSGKHGWVVRSSVITNVKELFISSNPFLYSRVCMYIHTADTRSIHSK